MLFTTSSAFETKKLGQKLAKKYRLGKIIALSGPLGAGKTTFTQGFAEGLGIKDKIISPSFIIKREYEIPGVKTGKFYHLDLYRLDENSNISELGLSEIFENPSNIISIEWPEKLGDNIPKNSVWIKFKNLSEEKRKIEIDE